MSTVSGYVGEGVSKGERQNPPIVSADVAMGRSRSYTIAPSSSLMEVGGMRSSEHEVRVRRTNLKNSSGGSEMRVVAAYVNPPWKKNSRWLKRTAMVPGDTIAYRVLIVIA